MSSWLTKIVPDTRSSALSGTTLGINRHYFSSQLQATLLVQFWLIKKTFSMELWVIVRIKIITIVFFFIKLVYTGVIIINQRIPLYKMCNCCHITHNQDNWNGLCLTLIDMSIVLQGRKQYCRIAVENADRFGDYLTQLTMCNIRFKHFIDTWTVIQFKYGIVQDVTIQNSTLKYGKVRYVMVWYDGVQYSTGEED